MSRIARAEYRQCTGTGADEPKQAGDDFTALEHSVIGLARLDALWTVRKPTRIRRMQERLLGRGNPRLASDKLEALRRMAVLAWHYGRCAPLAATQDFLASGFTPNQLQQLLGGIEAERAFDTASGA